jgi:hypothetical protein
MCAEGEAKRGSAFYSLLIIIFYSLLINDVDTKGRIVRKGEVSPRSATIHKKKKKITIIIIIIIINEKCNVRESNKMLLTNNESQKYVLSYSKRKTTHNIVDDHLPQG